MPMTLPFRCTGTWRILCLRMSLSTLVTGSAALTKKGKGVITDPTEGIFLYFLID
jgi:hypothetical protein